MSLTTPRPVKPGDRVYVISPSAGLFPFVEQRVRRAKANLEKQGLEVVIADNASKNKGYVSAAIGERISDIHQAFTDEKCSLIIAAIGGNHSNQLISKLDYELIRSNPKYFMGYSDNTVLHMALLTQANLQTVYGPCFLNQFGENPEVLPYTLSHFRSIVMEDSTGSRNIVASEEWTDEVLDWFKNEDETRPRHLQNNIGYHWWREGTAAGWALPGALPSINHVVGTKYFPDPKGAILLIDIPEGHSMHEGQPVAEVDAWLTDLSNTGLLSAINGLIIGRPYKYTPEMVEELNKVVMRIVGDYRYPVLFNVDFGHTDPMISIPVGGNVTLDSKAQVFTLSKK